MRPPRERPMPGSASLLPPEAERCAFTVEEAMSIWAGGPPALASVHGGEKPLQ